MTKQKDWIPSGNKAFNDFEKNFIKFFLPPAVIPASVPPGKVADLVTRQGIYEPAYIKIFNPAAASDNDKRRHRDEKKLSRAFIRTFAKKYVLFNDDYTDDQRRAMGVPVRDGSRSARPGIDDVPNLILKVLKGGVLLVEARTETDSTRASMHPDADCLETRIAVGTDPATWKEATDVHQSTKARVKLPQGPAAAGQVAYVYARWTNNSDETKSSQFTRKYTIRITE